MGGWVDGSNLHGTEIQPVGEKDGVLQKEAEGGGGSTGKGANYLGG